MTAPAGRYELSLGGPVQLGTLTADAVDISGDLTPASISVAKGLVGSIYNFQRTGQPAANQIDPASYSRFLNQSGGGTSAVPVGLIGRADVTGGSMTHAIGLLGWESPLSTDVVPLSNQGYIGVEGRSESNISTATVGGVVSQGVLGLALVGVANPTQPNTNIGVRGRVDFMPAIVSAQNNILYGGWFSINPAIPTSGGSAPLQAWSAVFGDAGNNWPVQFRGAISAAEADVNMSIDPTTVQFLIDTGVTTNVNGLRIRLRDAAGASAFDVVDNTGSNIIDVNSIHAITLNGLTITQASSASTAGLRLPHGAAPTTPTNGDLWTTTAGMFVRINGVTKSVNLT